MRDLKQPGIHWRAPVVYVPIATKNKVMIRVMAPHVHHEVTVEFDGEDTIVSHDYRTFETMVVVEGDDEA